MNTTVTYLDNNATTRPDPRVVEAMLPLLTEHYGNPSSAHQFGARVMPLIDEARTRVAALIGARESEIIFTSGGTEADNAAFHGLLAAQPAKRHVIISAVEHHAILEPAEHIEKVGYRVTRVPVARSGQLDVATLETAITADTALISIMLANNETGVIAPLAEVCRIAAARGVPVHTDAVNAVGKMPIDVESLGVALASLSGHKIYAPKGVGALYIRRGTPWKPAQIGGGQERGRRGGTLNAPGIVGLGMACELLRTEQQGEWTRIAALRDRFERELKSCCGIAHIIGESGPRLPNTCCACFEGLPSEPIVVLLSEAGVCVSAGAACSSGSLEVSHVLRAMGIPPEIGHGQIRFSFGRFNSDADVDRALEIVPRVAEKVAAAYKAG